MLVWQDMPSAWLGADKDKAQWEHELGRMILVWALITTERVGFPVLVYKAA